MRKRNLPLIMISCLVLLAGCGSSKSVVPSASEDAEPTAQVSTAETVEETAEETAKEEPKEEGSSKEDGKEEKQEEEDYFVFNGVANPYFSNRAASDGKDLYYVKNYKIFRLNPDGEDEQVFSTDGLVGIRSDMTGGDGMLFYFASCKEKDENGNDPTGIFCYDTASGTETPLYIPAASKLYYHDSWLYYYNGSEKQFRRCRPDGSEDMFLADGWGDHFSVSGSWLYYPDGNGKMFRVNLESLEIEEVQDTRSRVWFAYQGELVRVDAGLFNTDGDLLYITTPKGLFSSHSPDDPEENLLFETDHGDGTGDFPAFDSIVISGDFISFESSYAGDYHWYVIRKDGTFVKEIPY